MESVLSADVARDIKCQLEAQTVKVMEKSQLSRGRVSADVSFMLLNSVWEDRVGSTFH